MVDFFLQNPEIPPTTHPQLKAAINKLKHMSSEKKAIEAAFELLAKKYKSGRFRTYLYFWRAFETDPNRLWDRQGFLHCHQQNFLLRLLLVKSGWIRAESLRPGYSLVWYVSPHQFLVYQKGKHRRLALDPWNYHHGTKIGEYATGFGKKSLTEFAEFF